MNWREPEVIEKGSEAKDQPIGKLPEGDPSWGEKGKG